MRFRFAQQMRPIFPSVVAGDVGAARIDIRLELVADALGLQVGFFEDHETTDLE
jgi:hypothetical protein